jgi:Acyl-CoA synthetases (AMP-forming)/AMP-acid ligases II
MPMKIAFSTLGCPEWTWTEIYSMAHDLEYNGIEIRGLGEEITATRAQPFLPGEIERTTADLQRLNLSIPCFSSNCVLSAPDGQKEAIAEIVEYINLAAKVGAPYIRVLADRNPAPEGDVRDETVIEILKKLAPLAEARKVTLLVETNGVYADTSRLAGLLEAVDSGSVAALWDIHHPFRYFHESPETTWMNLGSRIKYIHIKDSVMDPSGRIRYRMPGSGDLPLVETLSLLHDNNFEGFVSLEWVKRWASEIEDAAVVFPHFVTFVRMWEATFERAEKKAGERTQDLSLKKRDEEKETYIRLPGAVGTEPDDRIRFVENQDGRKLFEKDILVDLTFGKLLEKVADTFPDQTAFAYTTRNYTRTYSEFLEDVDRTARMFLAMGVRKGDHIAIWSDNGPHWFLTFWAAVRIGAILVTVNTSYKIHEAEYLLHQSDTHTLVCIDGYKDSNYIAILNEICPELADSTPGKLNSARLPVLKNAITIDSKQPGCWHWDEAMALADSLPGDTVRKMQASIHPDDVCNMQYTSGTTGFPKGVMLTHRNVVNNGKCIGDCMNLSTADRFLIQVPMFHCFGMVLSMTASVTHGTTMVPVEHFSPRTVLPAITKRKITAMNGVPTMFIALLDHPDFNNTDFSHMRTGIMAGSPCPVPVMEAVVSKMGMKEITIVFGQTESSPGCTQSRVDDPVEVRVATVGRALPGVECRIVDPETNRVCPDNVPGEFVARGYNIMKGYYKMPEATKAAIDSEGWLHTGDLALRTPEGNYKITGRIKDMIIRGGENVYPKEIEEFLYTHPEVRDVQVIGVPDKTMGEEIMACVILKEGAKVTVDQLKDFVRTHMAKHKTPKYIEFVDAFPMNGAGKIMKYKMREWAVELLGLQKDAAIETA